MKLQGWLYFNYIVLYKSALDAKNEQIVQDSLEEFMKDKTIITIAHRI